MRIVKTPSFQIAINGYGDSNSDKLCIMMPGRLDTKDYINFVSHGNFLAGLGYQAIVIDPPCTWDSPGDLADYTMSNYILAVNELIELFGNKKTLLLGHSRGGATAMTVSKNPNVKALVLINSSYGPPIPPDKSKFVGGCLPENRDLPPGDKRTEEQVQFLLPMNYFQDSKKYNPLRDLKNFDGPKLIIHATGDEFTNIEKVKAIYSELAEPKMCLWVDKTHDYRLFPEIVEQVNRQLKKFIEADV